MDELLAEFLTDTTESLVSVDEFLLRLERNPGDQDTLSKVFRSIHTIKGTCGFLGLNRLQHLSHAVENVLGQLRSGKLAVGADLISTILRGIDRLKVILEGTATAGSEPPGDDAELIGILGEAAEGRCVRPAAAITAEVEALGPGAQTIRVGVDVLEELMAVVG